MSDPPPRACGIVPPVRLSYAVDMGTHDKDSAAVFAAHRAVAESELRREMEALGLHARDGWKIAEVTREARNGTELVLRPLHLRLEPPQGLECRIWIHEEDGRVDWSFAPPDAAPGGDE